MTCLRMSSRSFSSLLRGRRDVDEAALLKALQLGVHSARQLVDVGRPTWPSGKGPRPAVVRSPTVDANWSFWPIVSAAGDLGMIAGSTYMAASHFGYMDRAGGEFLWFESLPSRPAQARC